jgi:hypothetical protein
MIWYDIIWYDMIWYDMIWYDMIWYDMIWYDMIWYCPERITATCQCTYTCYVSLRIRWHLVVCLVDQLDVARVASVSVGTSRSSQGVGVIDRRARRRVTAASERRPGGWRPPVGVSTTARRGIVLTKLVVTEWTREIRSNLQLISSIYKGPWLIDLISNRLNTHTQLKTR